MAPESTLSTMCAYFEGWSILGILQPKYSVGAATGQQAACSYEPEGQQRCRPSFPAQDCRRSCVLQGVLCLLFFLVFGFWFLDFGSRGSNSLDSSSSVFNHYKGFESFIVIINLDGNNLRQDWSANLYYK